MLENANPDTPKSAEELKQRVGRAIEDFMTRENGKKPRRKSKGFINRSGRGRKGRR